MCHQHHGDHASRLLFTLRTRITGPHLSSNILGHRQRISHGTHAASVHAQAPMTDDAQSRSPQPDTRHRQRACAFCGGAAAGAVQRVGCACAGSRTYTLGCRQHTDSERDMRFLMREMTQM